MVLSDRIAVMQAGQILQCASPQEIYACPASLAVAELVGSPTINRIDAERQGMTLVLPDGVKVALPPAQADRFSVVPRYVCLGIRPEHIHITLSSGLGKGMVQQVEHFSKETHILLDCGVYTLTARSEAGCALRLGQAAAWTWEWEHVLCFDPHNGKNLHLQVSPA